MKMMLLLLVTYGVFSQLSILLSAGIVFLLYGIARCGRIQRATIISWFQKHSTAVLFTLLISELGALCVLLPILNVWFQYIESPQPWLLLFLFTALELFPAIFKYHKLKEFLHNPKKERIENPVYK